MCAQFEVGGDETFGKKALYIWFAMLILIVGMIAMVSWYVVQQRKMARAFVGTTNRRKKR